MPPQGRDKLSKIEELKSKLFSKNFQPRIEHRDNFSHIENNDVRDSWTVKEDIANMSQTFLMKTSLFKKFFIFSVCFFFMALAYGSYMFFAGGNVVSNNNIDISVLGNTFTAGGEELPLQISITNKNTLALDLVDLVVEYPKSSSGDLAGDTERIRQSLGTIPSGTIRNENIRIVLFGDQGSVRPVKISIEYRVENSNAIFIKEKLYEVNINSTPLNIGVVGPSEVSPNQDIVLNVKTTLNSTRAVSKMLMKVDYPVGFVFSSSEPKPSFGNNVWALGDLAPGSERNISITGKMVDVFDGEEKTFKIFSGSQSKSDKAVIDVVFNSLPYNILIKKPFIEAEFLIGGVRQSEYAVNSKSQVVGQIRWTNNLDTKINDLEIRAKLSGNALDRKSIDADDGFYDSATDTVIWNKSYIPEFREINPGESGVVRFMFFPSSLFSNLGGVMAGPTATVNISISGKQEVAGFESQELKNSDTIKIKIISDVGFANKVLYYTGPLTNTGPIPPKVGKETTYTITWSLSNSSNNLSKIVVRSSLPAWSRFVGPISPPNEDLSYNSSTKELTWNVGNLAKGVGITSASKEVSFRVSLSPSLSQIGQTPTLINDAVLTGHDDFANVDIRVNKAGLNTRVTNDAGFPTAGDRVVE
jgi:hypothetical protein